MNEILQSLLLDLSELSEEKAEEVTRIEYFELYTQVETRVCRRGELETHDGMKVTFYGDRFHHAFNTSCESAYSQLKKDMFDRVRAARVRWIGPIIRGKIEGAEYCHIPKGGQRDRHGRIRLNFDGILG